MPRFENSLTFAPNATAKVPNPQSANDAVNLGFIEDYFTGLNEKAAVLASSSGNINLDAPGSTIGGVTIPLNGRFLASSQTNNTQNGIYIWNGASVPATRSSDANTSTELNNATVYVPDSTGTTIGATYRQITRNPIIGTDPIIWTIYGNSVPDATTTTPGRVTLAASTNINNNTDVGKVVTVEALLGSNVIKRQAKAIIGNGIDSTFPISHTFNTFDVGVIVRRTAGDRADVYPDITRPTTGSVTVAFSYVPSVGEFTVLLEAY